MELHRIMADLADDPRLPMLATRIFPEMDLPSVKRRLLSYESVRQFQGDAMYRACRYVVQHTMEAFTYSGTEYIDGKPTLYISNHRDIVLDAMLLQYMLLGMGRDTTHVVVGTNLYEMDLMARLASVNKMIPFDRSGSGHQWYRNMRQLSQTIRQLVVQQGESVWIAQRGGRTKNGIDRTDPALIKMIATSAKDIGSPHPKVLLESLDELHIVPISISYEWEPCGLQKAREVCLSRQGPYTKQPGEDTQSILSGIKEWKGHVHLTLCPPLQRQELEAANESPQAVAELIDSRIAAAYRLYPNHTFASLLLQGHPLPDTPEAAQFAHAIDEACAKYAEIPDYRATLLRLYAAPLQKTPSSTQ